MAEYWFDGTDGSNSNNGLSVGAPKRSVESGLDVSGTCIFNSKRGTTVSINSATSPTGAFTLRPYGDGTARAKVYCASPLTHNGSSGSYTVSPGMHMIGPGTGSIVAVSVPQGSIHIDDVHFNGFWNTVSGGKDGGYVRNSRIWECANNAITIGDTLYAAPNGFEVTNNYIDATGALNDAITYHDGTGTGIGGLIARNYIVGANENSIDVLDQFHNVIIKDNICIGAKEAGIIVAGENCRIQGNWVEQSGWEGLSHHTGAANNVFVGNVVTNCGTAGVNANAFVARGVGTFWLYNNTFVAGALSRQANRMLSLLQANVTGQIANNIIAIIGASVNRYVEIFNADATLFRFRNNVYFGANGTTNPFSINNGSSRTFAQWQALSALGGGTQDVGGSVANPLLGTDYSIPATSPCKGAGVYIPGAKHFGGHSMSVVSPDIGAMRYFAPRAVTTR